jgi:PAS domain S-box-containing protein
MEWVKQVWKGKAALTLGTWVAYALAFLPLYRLLGAEATALVMFPVIVTGWCFGTWGGLLAGLLGFLLDVLLLTLTGEAGWQVMTGTVAGTILLVVGGTVVGRLCDLGERAKHELARRVQTEAALRRERDFAESLIETAQAVVLVLDTEGRIVRFNPYVEELSGYRLEEVQGKDWFTTFLPTRDQQRIRHEFLRALSDIQTCGNVNPIVTKDGREREIEWFDKTLKDPDGNVTGVLAVGQDITERLRAEATLERRVAELSALNAIATIVNESLDVEEILGRATDEALNLVGVEAAAMLLLNEERDELVMATHRGLSDAFVRAFSRLKRGEGLSWRAVETGEPVVLDSLAEYPAARKAYVEAERIESAAVVPLLGRGGTIGTMNLAAHSSGYFDAAGLELLVGLGRQIATGIEKVRLGESERKAVAAAAAAEMAANTVEAMADGVVLNDLDGRIAFANPAFQDMVGYDESELIGGTAIELVQRLVKPEDLDTALSAIGAALEGGAGVPSSVTLVSKEGREIPVAFTVSFIKDAAGQPTTVIVVFKDISELKRAEEVLRQSEQWLSTTLRSIGDAVLAADPEGCVTFMNPVAEALTGWEGDSAIGNPVKEVFHIVNERTGERAEDPVARVLREGVVVRLANHTILVAKDGTKRPIADSGAPIRDDEGNITGAVLIFRDITERRETQERLVRAEKLAVLGQLAGGVGHELRNPLGVISNAAYFLQMVLAPGEPRAPARRRSPTGGSAGGDASSDADETIQEYLGIISSQVRTAERIVSDLLDLSRTRPAEREQVALSELVAEVMEGRQPPEGVEVMARIASDLPTVFVDRLHIGQVLANLVSNTYQAMPEGGELVLSARAEEGRVCLSVADTGCGIPRENVGKIFEPLFTTRARGIGLGLAVSRNLVQVNGGTIEVQSEEGQGSTFTVALPTRDVFQAGTKEVVS